MDVSCGTCFFYYSFLFYAAIYFAVLNFDSHTILFPDILLKKLQFETDEKEIGQVVMKYLRSAPDRCGGRSRRSRQADESGSQDTDC